MNGKQVRWKWSILMVLVLAWILAACAPEPPPTYSPTPTEVKPTPSPTLLPTPTPTPTPMLPLQTIGWEGVEVNTLCLVVEQSYPQVEAEFPEWDASTPIDETCRNILETVGFKVVGAEGPCDATLAVSLAGWGVSGEDPSSKQPPVYVAPAARCSATLSAPGRQPLTSSGEAEAPPYVFVVSTDPRAVQFLEVQPLVLLRCLAELWGPEALVRALDSKWVNVCEAAAEALTDLGPDAIPLLAPFLGDLIVGEIVKEFMAEMGPEAVPMLVKALSDLDERGRQAARETLVAIAGEEEVISYLIQALQDEDPHVRGHACEVLNRLGPEAEEAGPALIQALEDENVRLCAASALANIGLTEKAIPVLIQALRDEDPRVRRPAVLTLANIGPEAREAVPVLIQTLGDEIDYVRRDAAYALGKIGPEEGVVSALIQALEDESFSVRQAAAYALGTIGPEAREAVPALIETLEDREHAVRETVTRSLGKIGPEEGVVPALIRALGDKNSSVRKDAASALGKIGPEEGVVPALIRALGDKNSSVRKDAASALGTIGPEAREAVPALIEILRVRGEYEWVRAAAAYALGDIGPEAGEAMPALIEILRVRGEYESVRAAAAHALGDIGPKERVMPLLFQALEDPHWGVRASACRALGEIGPEEGVVPALIQALGDSHHWVREAAAEGLEKIGPEAKEAVPELIQALKDMRAGTHATAARALGKIGPEEGVIPALVEALADSDWTVRSVAAESLGKIGSEAKEAVPALIQALRDTEVHVRRTAAEALENIIEQDFGHNQERWQQWWEENKQNNQLEQVETTTPTPSQEGGLQQVKIPIWSEEDFEEALKNLERAGGKEICWMNPRDTSPFYDGPVPLVYFVLLDISYSWIPYCHCFSEFRNVYLYGDRFGIAKGARTFDKFDRVVAEARFLRHLGEEKFEIEEFHYIPSAKSETRSKEVKNWGLRFQEPDGKLIFKCKSQFWSGHKIIEEEISGEKVRDYYFIWPSGY